MDLGVGGKQDHQTSDPTLKTDVANLPAVLPLVIRKPRRSGWGRRRFHVLDDTVEEQDAPLTEMRGNKLQRIVVANSVCYSKPNVTERLKFPLAANEYRG